MSDIRDNDDSKIDEIENGPTTPEADVLHGPRAQHEVEPQEENVTVLDGDTRIATRQPERQDAKAEDGPESRPDTDPAASEKY